MRLGDLDDLKKKLNFVYDCAYIGSKSKEGIVSDIIDEIDNAPTVEINTNDIEYKAYCKGLEDGKKIARPQGQWVEVERQGRTGDGRVFTYTIIVCSNCGEQFDLEGEKFCPHCGAEMQKGGAE